MHSVLPYLRLFRVFRDVRFFRVFRVFRDESVLDQNLNLKFNLAVRAPRNDVT